MDEYERRSDTDEASSENNERNVNDASGYSESPTETSGSFGFSDDGTYHFSKPTDDSTVYREQNVNRAENAGNNDRAGSVETQGSCSQGGYHGNVQYGAPNSAANGGYQKSNPYPYQHHSSGYAYPVDERPKKKNNGGKIFGIITGTLCVILIVALVVVVGIGKADKQKVNEFGTSFEDASVKNGNVDELVTAYSPEASGKNTQSGELSAKAIYNKVLASSVGILVYSKSDTLASEGSGVLFKVDNDERYTYIVTCAHVISNSTGGVIVQLYDERQYTAEVVGFDTRTDIGVLRIEESGLQLAEIGDSSTLAVGDEVYAIGNPGGVEFANSFTNGMISALDRPVNSSSSGYTMECIQHTAAINPGNSGGALVNVFGQVVGINSMKIVDDEYEGMGFSVPSSVFVDIVNNIIANGYVANRPKLGITYVSAQNYNSYGMFVAIKGLPAGSIVIYSISDDSSFAGTEAKEGDMIVAVNGKELDDASYLPELIEKSNVGDVITLSLVRINKDYSYQEFEVDVTLVEDRGDTVTVQEEQTTENYEDYFKQYFGDYFGDFFR